MDLGILLLLLPYLLPLMLLLTFLIGAIDRATPFFYQMRVGKDGIPFKLYKFNTMGRSRYNDVGYGACDERATKLGKLIRLLVFDEIPQMVFNVILGDLGLVGPRPLLQADFDLMKQRLTTAEYTAWSEAYISVYPGWTGKFGLDSRRYAPQSDTYLRARKRHDINYCASATWYIDIWIICIHTILPFVDINRRCGHYVTKALSLLKGVPYTSFKARMP
jgi:lipopolysaccharide/colanic/teichoic acid biosynthesis glycosyltransferase